MTEEFEQEVDVMCNLGYAIETEAYNKGRREAKREAQKEERKKSKETELKRIRSLMNNLHLTAKDAMDALDIPEKDRKGLIKILEAENKTSE